MHIKQVIIEGFKSYKEQTKTIPFSNKINTIIGANGSGKSNFFQAIRFVLDAETSSMRQEERQKLLHEGAGHAVLSAYVEIVLDNSDGRIQVEKEEVRLRRTVGLKKDEYQLNKKKTSKSEISDILESAGFSKANPYYVVQQGKIMALSMMKDEERLDLLKEIGGSKVYEDRRRESLRILHEADGRKRQIAELVVGMESKLKQLDAEREELEKYQKIDRERRSLEYAIHDKEVSDTRAALEQIEQERQEEAERAGRALQERQAAHAGLKAAEKELKALGVEQGAARAKLAEATRRKEEAVSRQAQLDLDIDDLEKQGQSGAQTKAQCKQELKSLGKEIHQAEAKLKQAAADLREKQAAADAMAAKVDQAQRRLEVLEAKQGQSQAYKSVADRNRQIGKEVAQREGQRGKLQEQIGELQDKIAQLHASKKTLAEEVGKKEASMGEVQQRISDSTPKRRALEGKMHQLQNELRDARSNVEELRSQRKKLEDEVTNLHRKVAPGGGHNRQALAEVRKLSWQHNIPLHGTVLELISVLDQLHTATEVAAGGALFHVVVDNQDQASKLLNLLRRETGGRGGRITCLPLTKLLVAPTTYPTTFGDAALPLTKYVKCPEAVQKAIDHVFGKWMVCKDSDVASQVIRSTKDISCVTIRGDLHAKKGTITGGHRDEKSNKITAHKSLVKREEELREVGEEQAAQSARIPELEGQKIDVENEIMNLKLAEQRDMTDLKAMKELAKADSTRLAGFDSSLESSQRTIQKNQATLEILAAEIKQLQADLGSKELSKLTAAEAKEKDALEERLDGMMEEQGAVQAALLEAEAAHEEVEGSLTNNLRKRQAELEALLASTGVTVDNEELESKRSAAVAAREETAREEEEEARAEARVEELSQRAAEVQAEADRLREKQKAAEEQEEGGGVAQLVARRSALQQKKAEHEKKIRELGSLPSEAFDAFRQLSMAQLSKQLAKAQKNLKKYGHVNKKALDQYLNFTEQKEVLVARHDETVRGKDKIQQLINALDLRKDEAIERTFKGVARNFREIFAELAPGGKGELVMQKAKPPKEAAPPTEEGDAEEANEEVHRSHERYSGVKVKVSFGAGETMSLKQLSGGQKTLVALALIFSIQRLDPAPFYLFDEIDAALDPAYRTTVAKMLARQANDPNNPSQFIITTFHPQILYETDQAYGVAHTARISTIDEISREAALDFLASEEKKGRHEATAED